MPTEYNIRPSDYYWRGKENLEDYLEKDSKPSLIYSALEFRCCIERVLFEELFILKIDDIPKIFNKIYRVTELKNWILGIEPDFYDKLKFINLFLEALEIPDRNFIPDLDFLNRIYGRLGNYLHLFKNSSETVELKDWWNDFKDIVVEAEEYLTRMIGGMATNINLNKERFLLFDDWKSKKLSDQEVIMQMRKDIFLKQ